MKLYYHPASTVSLMIQMFASEEGIALDYQLVDLMTGAQRSPEYLAINPNGLVPCLDDAGFRLTESGAILRYLAAKSGSAAYPTDLQARARVEERMEWFYSNFYKDFAYALVYPQLFPHHKRRSDECHAGTLEWGCEKTKRWLGLLDQQLIGPNQRFLCGDTISLADYVGAEMINLGELIQCSFAEYPNIRRWMGEMRALKSWAKVHEVAAGFAASLREKTFLNF